MTTHTSSEYRQGRRQDVAAGGPKLTRGGTFLNTMLDVCSNRHVNLLTL